MLYAHGHISGRRFDVYPVRVGERAGDVRFRCPTVKSPN